MQALTSPNILWEDVSGHIEFKGLDGVRDMVQLTIAAIPDCKFTHHGGMKHGNAYVVEWTMSGTIFGQEFACRGRRSARRLRRPHRAQPRLLDSRSFPEMQPDRRTRRWTKSRQRRLPSATELALPSSSKVQLTQKGAVPWCRKS